MKTRWYVREKQIEKKTDKIEGLYLLRVLLAERIVLIPQVLQAGLETLQSLKQNHEDSYLEHSSKEA